VGEKRPQHKRKSLIS